MFPYFFFFFSALLASFFPGAGSLVGLSTRSAYYTARAANSLTNLARKLNTTALTIWRVTNNAVKLTTFVTRNLKKIILGSNSVSIGMIFFTLCIISTFPTNVGNPVYVCIIFMTLVIQYIF